MDIPTYVPIQKFNYVIAFPSAFLTFSCSCGEWQTCPLDKVTTLTFSILLLSHLPSILSNFILKPISNDRLLVIYQNTKKLKKLYSNICKFFFSVTIILLKFGICFREISSQRANNGNFVNTQNYPVYCSLCLLTCLL